MLVHKIHFFFYNINNLLSSWKNYQSHNAIKIKLIIACKIAMIPCKDFHIASSLFPNSIGSHEILLKITYINGDVLICILCKQTH